ncbi:SpoIIE family protein phosphatase [Streptomyces sp. NPDC026673]|uniref:SpoIIE family protein phosphatase n=1 Tax=Streptomyces sp. NPDC026673 TaxID=3155724 RepID=UPI0033CB90F7
MTAAGPPEGAGLYEVALFEQARTGLEVYDLRLRVLRANPAALAVRGLPEDAVVGAALADLDSGIPLSHVMAEVLETGSAVFDRPVDACPADDPGNRRDYAVNGYPLRADGRPIGVAAMIRDVTEDLRKQRELDLLNMARAGIGSTLDPLRTAQELADIAVPCFADAVAVDLVESVFSGDAPVGPVTVRLPMRRAAFTSRDGQYGAFPTGSASHFAFPTPYTQALGDLRPRLVETVPSSGGWLVHDRARADFIARSGARSLIVSPLTVHGLVLGLASFYRDGSNPRPFDEEDLSLATQLATCTAVCVDNARRFIREHAVATALQRSLLPRTPPETAAVRSSHCYLPGRYGAHWFDVLPLSSCRVGLIIGYVPGDDLQASAAMGRLRTAASTLAAMDLPPDELMTHLDDVGRRLAAEQDADPVTLHQARPPFTASCLYLTYDPVTHRCAAASAGHASPLLTSPEGVVGMLEVPCGAPLGQGAPYDPLTTELRPGSLLTLYSDGSTWRHPAEAAERVSRLREVVAEASLAPEQVCDEVAYRVLRGSAPQDGSALLVARTRSIAPDRMTSWTFPAEALSVGEARRAARGRLAEWGLEDQVPVTDLVVSELATNVIRHATGPIRLRLILDRGLTVEVHDDADTAPHLRHARLQDEGGRGLFLVASLTRHWGTRYEERGKTIWAEQELTGA